MRRITMTCTLLLLTAFACCAAEAESSLSGLPEEAQTPISAVLGRSLPAYALKSAGAGFEATNPMQNLSARFDNQGIEVHHGNTMWKMSVHAYGRGEILPTLQSTRPTVQANRIEYRRGALTEWYVNGPAGLEQGFTVSRAPGNSAAGPLTISTGVAGDLEAALDPSGRSLSLSDHHSVNLQYAGLTAHDADGRELRAWMELRGDTLLLKVTDEGARYPIVIDPTFKQAKLLEANPRNGDDLGTSVAISGNTIVAGAPGAYVNGIESGAAFVFLKPANGWANMTESAELYPSDGVDGDEFGTSVAISGDHIAVGAPYKNSNLTGAAYYFVKPLQGWTGMISEYAPLGFGHNSNAFLGTSVAINGNAVLVGSPGENSAYLLICALNVTSCGLDATFFGSNVVNVAFGTAVAVSGNDFVVTDPYATVGNTQFVGAAYVYTYVGHNTWTKATLTPSDGELISEMGISVAMSSNTIVAGCPFCRLNNANTPGAAYVFSKPVTGWADATQTAKLTPSDGVQQDAFGTGVAVAGGLIIAGSPRKNINNNPSQGEAYLFIEPVGGWRDATENVSVLASDGQHDDSFGQSVSVAGATGVIGASTSKNGQFNLVTGAAYVFNQ